MKTFLKKFTGKFLIVAAMALMVSFFTSVCSAQTDITSTVSTLSGYWTAIATVAITVLLFVVGRRLVRKL
jgi:predicted neutral ceramidase superfamily lipid hydrolase